MAKEINTIGVLTSGGDAPGMNAAIRAVVREAFHPQHEKSTAHSCRKSIIKTHRTGNEPDSAR